MLTGSPLGAGASTSAARRPLRAHSPTPSNSAVIAIRASPRKQRDFRRSRRWTFLAALIGWRRERNWDRTFSAQPRVIQRIQAESDSYNWDDDRGTRTDPQMVVLDGRLPSGRLLFCLRRKNQGLIVDILVRKLMDARHGVELFKRRHARVADSIEFKCGRHRSVPTTNTMAMATIEITERIMRYLLSTPISRSHPRKVRTRADCGSSQLNPGTRQSEGRCYQFLHEIIENDRRSNCYDDRKQKSQNEHAHFMRSQCVLIYHNSAPS
jgi:hypothetical protein